MGVLPALLVVFLFSGVAFAAIPVDPPFTQTSGFWCCLLPAALFFSLYVVLWFHGTYNKFVALRNSVDKEWSQVEVELQRKFDLIPNLVASVGGYAKHERGTFAQVTEARSAWGKARTVEEKISASNMLAGALKTLFAVSENYPRLKADENFRSLQAEFSNIENRIASERAECTEAVYAYNTAIQSLPGNFLAFIFCFKPRKFFQATQPERQKVELSVESEGRVEQPAEKEKKKKVNK